MRKKKKNNTLFIAFCIIIFIIFLTAIIVITSMHSAPLSHLSDKKQEKIVDKERDSEYVRPDVINPMQKESFFQKYNGNVPEGDVLEKITGLVYYFTDNKQSLNIMNEEELSSEYEKNTQNINNIGILNVSDFIEITKLYQTLNNNLELSYVYFDLDTLEVVDDVTKIELEIKYVGMDEIRIKMDLNNEYDKSKDFIKFYSIE